ncbi:lytic transglycosylase domain-containing protein [Oricola sp.]|uniref:lytic transglycosylase domain-containing protein n=1 Tax=Oricola sp. TaxID=1979950 RepID=UPI0025D37734|nr:lytic transglycosylase domain-containing protein [Oricola sp.]
MSLRIVATLCLAAALVTQARAEDGQVRVVLPLQLDNVRPDQEFERVDPDADRKTYDVETLCNLIATSADAHGLPRSFFTRLIWKESRFDISALSRAGAQGIAQFMPGTAYRRGLRDPFDPEQAIPASAAYLSDLRTEFGNLGLAAAAYNAGEERVSSWLARGGYLPGETQGYLLAIFGKTAESFREMTTDEEQPPLREGMSFDQACRELPVTPATVLLYDDTDAPAWGVQLAGHFDRAVALRIFEEVRIRHAGIIGEREPAVFSKRSTIGRRPLHVVQIGAADKREASDLCNQLRLAGASCVVVKN